MKLFNKGKRTVHFLGGVLEPEKSINFKGDKEAEGKKLLALFPDELIDIEKVSEPSVPDSRAAEVATAAKKVSDAEEAVDNLHKKSSSKKE